MLLLTLAAAALIIGSGAASLRIVRDENASRFALESVLQKHAPTVRAPSTQGSQQVLAAYSHLPLMFEPNQGQADARVRFLARGTGYGLYFTADEAVLALRQSSATQHGAAQTSVVRMKLAGANSAVEPTGDTRLPGRSNYFIGNDPAQWHRDIPQFARVRYANVYPGIDLVYYGNRGRLEYDFEVAPGSDPKLVALKFQGPRNLRIDANGDLVLAVGHGDVRLQTPRVYQKFGAEERKVAGRFELRSKEKDEVGFQLGAYDRSRALIIDPVLTYATYLGGTGDEACSVIAPIMIAGIPAPPAGCPAIAVDPVGNAYVAGSTNSTDFPVTSGVFQTVKAGPANAFIAKFNIAGSLVFATYLGGNGTDYTAGIAVDGGFNVIVAGTTSSSNFPTSTTAFQTAPATVGKHVFVSQLNNAGTKLLYSTYLSGSGADIASGLALDPGGNAYVTGTTASNEFETGFPSTLGSYQPAPAPGSSIQFFMSKIDPNLSGTASVPYSTYFGGANPSGVAEVALGGGIAVDSTNNVYFTGGTNFTDLPKLNAYQPTNKGGPNGLDAFVAKLNPAGVVGAQLVYSTYLGGSGDDVGNGIAVDSTTNAYVTGWTASSDFVIPTGTTPFQANPGGGTDAFVAKFGLPCSGSTCTTPLPLSYFSYLGGSGTDVGTAIAVDSNQGARIAGWTSSTNFPTPPVGNPLQTTFAGGASDAFLARIDTLSTANSSSYFGGNGNDFGTSIAIDQQGSSYLTGETSSLGGFLNHPFQGQLHGNTDAFVSKLGPVLSLTIATPTVTPSPASVGSTVSFVYTITNSGDFTNGVSFTDQLQASGATFVSATAAPGSCGAPVGVAITCAIGTLNNAATATVTIVVTPVAPTVPGGPVTLGNSGSAGIGGSTLATANASVQVNDFSLQVAPASATVPAGVPATFTATVTPSSVNSTQTGFPASVSISCGSGLPTGATCLLGSNNPIPNLDTGAQSSQVVINTTARVTTTTELRHGGGLGVPLYAAWFPVSGLALLGLRLGGKRSRQRRIVMGLLLGGFFALILFQPACGSSSHSTITSGTPAGTYPITINATSGSNATRSTVLTLVVR